MPAPEVTYQDYERLWGGALAEDAFSAALPEAASRVQARLALFDLGALGEGDAATYRRAVCAACDRLASPGKASWSAGKASVSYLDGDAGSMTVDAAIERCLAGTRLSFTGL